MIKRLSFFLVFLSIFVIGCSTDTSKKGVAVDAVDGIQMPESAATMEDGGIVISEIGEFGKDDDGKIVLIRVDGTKKIIADSGLNDPKGLIVEAGTIYVTDNLEVKKVSMNGNVEVWLSAEDFPRKPQFLNDIVSGDNAFYVSDSGDLLNGKGGGAIFKIDADKKVSVLVDASNDATIRSPNGLSTFQKNYLTFNDFENGFLFRVNLNDSKVEKISEGYGGADGLVSHKGNLYISDWKNGKVFKLNASKPDNQPELLKDGMEGSADIDVTKDGKYLVIPEMKANRVVIHPLN